MSRRTGPNRPETVWPACTNGVGLTASRYGPSVFATATVIETSVPGSGSASVMSHRHGAVTRPPSARSPIHTSAEPRMSPRSSHTRAAFSTSGASIVVAYSTIPLQLASPCSSQLPSANGARPNLEPDRAPECRAAFVTR